MLRHARHARKKNGDYPASASASASWIKKANQANYKVLSAVSTHDTNMLLLLLLPPKKIKINKIK